MTIATVNPASGERVREFPAFSTDRIDWCLAQAATTFRTYRSSSFAERAEWMTEAADILDGERDRAARTVTTEMGKTITAAREEVDRCARACRYFADHAAALLADEPANAGAVGARSAYAIYEPLGPILAIMPWNFPLWQVVRFAAPALMAGNVGLLKHASNVPQTALFIQELFARAGFPKGAFQTLLIGSDRVEAVLRDDRVRAVTCTGSARTGAAVATIAGGAVKRAVLELGGSDPFIVMPSADLALAAEVGARSRCVNSGQSCIAAKRFIVHDDVAEEFEDLFVAKMRALVVGDPLDERTEVGPLATRRQLSDLTEQVADATGRGATVLCGGTPTGGPGYYYPPTVLSQITSDMRVHSEEVFGPVATLYRARDIEEVIALANHSPFGLGASAWTEVDGERRRFLTELEAGMVFLNGAVTSYPELPFGGMKASGLGRELGAHGIRELCNLKSIWIGKPG